MQPDAQTCFVVMPFSKTTSKHVESYWALQFADFLKPPIEENSAIEARRSQQLRGDILRGFIEALIRSAVVVADLTDRNPNVY